MVLCSSGRGSNRAKAAFVVAVMLQMFAMSHWPFFILRRVLETYLKRTCKTYFKRTLGKSFRTRPVAGQLPHNAVRGLEHGGREEVS